MLRHMATILADRHAKDKANWLLNNSDDLFNYSHSNCPACELKVTREGPEASTGNVIYLNSFMAS